MYERQLFPAAIAARSYMVELVYKVGFSPYKTIYLCSREINILASKVDLLSSCCVASLHPLPHTRCIGFAGVKNR